MRKTLPYITISITLLMITIFLLCQIDEELRYVLALETPLPLEKIYSLFTYILVHYNLIHLIGNVSLFIILSGFCELVEPRRKFIRDFTLSIVSVSVVYITVMSNRITCLMGISGVICFYLAKVIMLGILEGDKYTKITSFSALTLVLIHLISDDTLGRIVHITGFLLGFLVTILDKKLKKWKNIKNWV